MGRFLTRSGDQAWDFAVPLVLLKLLPGELRVAAIYYLLVRLAHVLVFPKLASVIDRVSRFRAAKLGITFQLIGVVIGAAVIEAFGSLGARAENPYSVILLMALVLGGVLSGLGSSFMDVSIANDLVPSGLAKEELADFNGRLRQIDLFTEVASPIAAGLLLLIETPAAPLLGFHLVALWNVLSFFPEYALLRSIFRSRPDLEAKKLDVPRASKASLFVKLTGGWRAFFREPVAPAAFAYALLWLSVLSPHGVLLTAFLKDGWKLPEWAIGLFRGAGAVFGLMATALYPWVTRRLGLIAGARAFIVYQACMVVVALVCFAAGGLTGQIGFLCCILASRIGLYGFSLGEMQIRQEVIRPEVRGEVNGFASALTGVATLGLYAAGALLPATGDFVWLVGGSVTFVALGAVLFTFWSRTMRIQPD